MNGQEHLGEPGESSPEVTLNQNADASMTDESAKDQSTEYETKYERVIPRLLRNIVVFGLLLLIPASWFYRAPGAIGFVFGAAVSYVNFRSLKLGVEGLADRVVNQSSREKGGLIVFRFIVRYGLVGAVAYAIFLSSPLAFRGFLWGLCVPVAALMAEALWQGYAAFRQIGSG
jgi:ATP synthase I chain